MPGTADGAAFVCVTSASAPAASATFLTSDDLRCTDDSCVNGKTYFTRSEKGGARSVVGPAVHGLSLQNVINGAGVPVGSVHFVTVSYDDDRYYSRLILTADDLAVPSPFEDRLLPVLYADSGNVTFLRPLRRDDNDDVNFYDRLSESGNARGTGYLHVDIHTAGSPLDVQLDKNDASGELTALAASTSALRYRWYVDGELSDNSGPTFSYKPAPSACPEFVIVVAIGTDDTSYGESPAANIGGPRTADCGTGGGGGPSVPPSRSPSPGRGVPPSAAAHPTTTSSPTPTATPTAPTATPATTRGIVGPNAGAGAASTASGRGTATAVPTPVAGRSDGDLVSGLLLNDPGVGGGAAAPGPPGAATTAEPPHEDGGIDLAWLWLLVPIVLVASGVAVERRRA